MLKKFQNKKAQVIAAEYVLVFFIVVGAMTSMGVYFRRAIQAKMRDANKVMIDIVANRTEFYYPGATMPLYAQYETYYTNAVSNTYVSTFSNDTLTQGGSAGIYRKTIDNETRLQTKSIVAPPVMGD